MAEGNGTSVTWRELNLLRETIETKFNNLSNDIAEIKEYIETSSEDRKANRRAWLPPVAAAFIAAFVSFPAYFIH